MIEADWTTGAVEGRALVVQLRQMIERALGMFPDSNGGSAHDGYGACVLSMLVALTPRVGFTFPV